MSTYAQHRTRFALQQRGFTLVELMVTVGIALFLLGGLVTIVQNVRTTNLSQTALTQLQDEERFALTVLTDAIQTGGYFADPITDTTANFGAVGAFVAGSAFAGTHTVGAADSAALDTISTRFITKPGYGPILCNGVDTSQEGAPTDYTITFSVAGEQLLCSVNGGPNIQLVTGVHAMAVYYGVNRAAPNADYNVDTYITADNFANVNDYLTISSVRVVLTFDNPLYFAGGPQPQLITVERVIEVMARAGVHT
jgi:type IV pilus assembly protein PilW